MTGLLSSMGVDPGITNWWDSRRNAITQFGAGLARGEDFGEGIAMGTQGAALGRTADDAYATTQKEKADREAQLQKAIENIRTKYNRPEVADWLSTAGPDGINSAWGEVLKGMKPNGGAGDATFFGTPIWGTTADGQAGFGQLNNQGQFQLTEMPEGFQVGKDPIRLDAGTHFVLLDPVTRQPVGQIPKDGSVPEGFRMGEGGDSMAPLPGSPAAMDAEASVKQDQMRREMRATYADIVTEDIDRVIGAVEGNPMMTTGLGAAATQGMPGTPAFNAKQLADTVRANVGFDRLQQMREASPTGGALGQVSNFENLLLQATLGNLELSQDQGQILRNLERVKEVYRKIVLEGITPDDPMAQEIMGGRGGAGASNSVDDILSGYGL